MHSGSILQGKGDFQDCSCHRAVMILENGMKVVDIVVEKRHHSIVTVDEVILGITPERRTLCAVHILR